MIYGFVDHNSQGLVYDPVTGQVNWPYVIKKTLITFAIVYTFIIAPAMLVIRQVAKRCDAEAQADERG